MLATAGGAPDHLESEAAGDRGGGGARGREGDQARRGGSIGQDMSGLFKGVGTYIGSVGTDIGWGASRRGLEAAVWKRVEGGGGRAVRVSESIDADVGRDNHDDDDVVGGDDVDGHDGDGDGNGNGNGNGGDDGDGDVLFAVMMMMLMMMMMMMMMMMSVIFARVLCNRELPIPRPSKLTLNSASLNPKP
eukprot:3402756-Rhodomonas_salina.1